MTLSHSIKSEADWLNNWTRTYRKRPEVAARIKEQNALYRERNRETIRERDRIAARKRRAARKLAST